MTTPPVYPKPQPVRNVQRIVMAANAVVTALAGVTLISGQVWVAWVIAVWGLFMVGYNAYQSDALPQRVVPLEDTAAYINEAGTVVAGPASPITNGSRVDTVPVDQGSPIG